MRERVDIAYRYDGSFDGLMCCVFDSFEPARTALRDIGRRAGAGHAV